MKIWKDFFLGSAHPIKVEPVHVEASTPCDKQNCMVNLAIYDLLCGVYGEHNFKLKSTNHGIILYLKGRRITGVFDTRTCERIWSYDRIYKKTKSEAKAKAACRNGFKVRVMVESNLKHVPEPMSEEAKKKLKAHKRDRSSRVSQHSRQRQLSM